MTTTADVIEFWHATANTVDRGPDLTWDQALTEFVRSARTAVVPAPLLAALQSPAASVVVVSVNGAAVRVQVGAGSLGGDLALTMWRRLKSLRTELGDQAQTFTTCGERVQVAPAGTGSYVI